MGRRRGHIVVTGAAGFLGGHVVHALRERRFEVTGLDDLSLGLAAVTERADRFVRLDIRDRSALYALLSNKATDAVVHLAGLHDARRARRDPEQVTEVNVGGTASLLGAMRPANLRRLVLGSALDVYGDPGTAAAVTEETLVCPTTPLGRSQAAVEALVADTAAAWGLEASILRLAQLGGALPVALPGGYRPRGLLGRLLRAARRNHSAEPFIVEGRAGEGGFEPRVLELLHVADATEAVVIALEHLLAGAGVPVANVSRGVGESLQSLVVELRQLTDRDFPSVSGALGPGRPAVLVASAARLREHTGWAPTRSLPGRILADAWAAMLGEAPR